MRVISARPGTNAVDNLVQVAGNGGLLSHLARQRERSGVEEPPCRLVAPVVGRFPHIALLMRATYSNSMSKRPS